MLSLFAGGYAVTMNKIAIYLCALEVGIHATNYRCANSNTLEHSVIVTVEDTQHTST